jgi:hypothetical protein
MQAPIFTMHGSIELLPSLAGRGGLEGMICTVMEAAKSKAAQLQTTALLNF